ncbi:MAG: helix-hairpin-helix domain-containing protein [Pseudomonadota bacterium]
MKKRAIHQRNLRPLAAFLFLASLVLLPGMTWAGKKAGGAAAKAKKKVKIVQMEEPAENGHGDAQPATGVVNVNTASPPELCLLPGIGPKKAQAIIKARSKKPFQSAKDLLRVKGIGRKSLKKLLVHVAVSGATTLKQKVSAH